MVVPYSRSAATKIISAAASSEEQLQFLHLLQGSERDQLGQSVKSEAHQLRQLFQLWQQQLQQQYEQLQVQRQIQALYDALLRQRTEQQLWVQQQLQQDQVRAQQEQLGKLQLQVFSLERNQRAEQRQRQALQRQLQQACRATQLEAAAAKPPALLYEDDCCPCALPEECPYNPCFPTVDIEDFDEREGCLLCEFTARQRCLPYSSKRRSPKIIEALLRSDESDTEYMADDEASFSSEVSSSDSSFNMERRRHIQEIRSLKNTCISPRYRQSWRPLRCYYCGSLYHLAAFCHTQPTTSL